MAPERSISRAPRTIPGGAARYSSPRIAERRAEYVREGLWADRTISSFLKDAALKAPSHTAIVDGDVRLDYGEAIEFTGRIASALNRLGIRRGRVVAYQLPNWHETALIHHAVTSLGLINNPIIPIYRDHELAFILKQGEPQAVFIPHEFRGFDYVAMFEDVIRSSHLHLRPIVVRSKGELPAGFVSFEEFLEGGPRSELRDAADPRDPTLLLYTSGTTSSPKGVLHSHESLVYENQSIIDWLEVTTEDVVFMASPLTHITGLLYGIQLPPMLGIAVVYQDIWNAPTAVELIEREHATFSVAATPFLQGLVQEYQDQARTSSLRVFACGGADVPPELISRARGILGGAVMRVYGSSEFPTFSCSRPDDPADKAGTTDGRPIGPVSHRIADPALRSVEGGAVGELIISGPDCFLGYLDTSLNAEAFTPDGYFRTGDLASEDADGFITIHGRQKDIIIRNGEKISAKELEDLLYQHPAVREVAVVAMPDVMVGERACAYVVIGEGEEFTFDLMIDHLASFRIARQKLPERLEIWPGELPKTSSGKIQKFKLRDDIRTKITH
jgi:cyclohexanecarboxylate-CoA ligase